MQNARRKGLGGPAALVYFLYALNLAVWLCCAASKRPTGGTSGDRWPCCRAFGIEHWNGKMELGAHTDLTVDPYAASVRFHQVLCNGQSQAGTSGLAGSR